MMALSDPRFRKGDFLFVVAALGLLWGPGLVFWERLPVPVELGPRAGAAAVERRSPCAARSAATDEETRVVRSGLTTIEVVITGYGSDSSQTDDSPMTTATSTQARPGVIALSQDLLDQYTPGAPFSYHDIVEVPGLGRFTVEDTMHPRWRSRADIWFSTRGEALAWGLRKRRIYRIHGRQAQRTMLASGRDAGASFGQANFQ